jgi:hypothetical protein
MTSFSFPLTPNPDRGRARQLPSVSLEDLNRHPFRDLINYPRRIPIRQADTTVTSGPTNRVWAVGSVDSDSAFA